MANVDHKRQIQPGWLICSNVCDSGKPAWLMMYGLTYFFDTVLIAWNSFLQEFSLQSGFHTSLHSCLNCEANPKSTTGCPMVPKRKTLYSFPFFCMYFFHASRPFNLSPRKSFMEQEEQPCTFPRHRTQPQQVIFLDPLAACLPEGFSNAGFLWIVLAAGLLQT